MNRSDTDKRKLILDAVPKLKLPTQIMNKTILNTQTKTKKNQPNTAIMIESNEFEKRVENEKKTSFTRASGIKSGQSALTSDKMTGTNHLHQITRKGVQSINITTTSQEYKGSSSGSITEASTTGTQLYPPSHRLGGVIKDASAYTIHFHAIQTLMHQLNTSTNRSACLQLALKLYLRFPKAYKHLQKALEAPKVSEFKNLFKNVEISMDMRNLFFMYLAHKAIFLTEKQKICSVSIAEIKIKPRFYYDIKKDLLVGIHDYDGALELEPASMAVVLIVQGIYCDWKQPFAVAYLADETMSIKPWVVNNIQLLIDIGYNVQAIVCQKDSHRFVIQNKEKISFRYLKSRKKEIFCTYDIMSLLKNFYYNFTQSDYDFDGGIVKCQDIIKFYESDSKKELPLNPKLSDEHIHPANLQELKMQSVMDVCCITTAAAMSTYIDFGVLDKTASKTVQFIVKMSNIFDAFNAGRAHDKTRTNNDFTGTKAEIRHLTELLQLIESAHMVEQTGNPSLVKMHEDLLEKINIFNNFILNVSEFLDDLPLQRLTAAAADIFTEQTQVHSKSITEPTARDVKTMFKQTAIIHLLKNPSKDSEAIDMPTVLSEFQAIVKVFNPISPPDYGEPRDFDESDYFIVSSEYNALELEKKNGIIFIAGFLLKKCHKFHRCSDLNLCIYTTSKNVECLSMCESIMDDVRNGICSVPNPDFIEYVESMEIVFRTFMIKKAVGSKYILAGLLSCLESVDAPLPCKCFPVNYLQKLYSRFRIYHTLKFNNELMKSKTYKRLVVNSL